MNRSIKIEKLNDNENIGENLTESFSEQMSKEENLYYNNNKYFIEQWDFKHKIINKTTNSND